MTEQEVIAIIKKNYPKCCKMVNGRYKGGFDNTDCELGQAFNIAINALEEIQKYRKIEKDLKENYHANVDIPLLMKHFIETVFKVEKHEGFCILTNEDKEAWEEYQAIGTPEECRAAVEKQTAKRPRIMGNAMICPSCPRYFKSDNSANCPSCGQKLKWENEE